MQCSCGGETICMSHIVKRIDTAEMWFPNDKLTAEDLPIKVTRDVCSACGRERKLPPLKNADSPQ